MSIYDIPVQTIKGKTISLEQYRGKVLIIVNTASKCGFTPQYKGLEGIYKEYKGQGLEILGFPCDQFGHQEPGSEDEISEFCEINFGVTFPLFSKVEVNGSNAHPLFTHLKEEAPGLLGSKGIKWNFTKFLVDAEGNVVGRFAPKDDPKKLIKPMAKLLTETA
ncbi:glutathione peroxidase [Sansalvadorimonas verongulae]|uniref:glutathione peroxidase n=1 Tax=Sansalvadorimonas verongulae TaxID=2172824 RepID=UPI0012BC68E2|nr:glutathione peroxidase [Sansalvadorimonas verongulae]MTI14412.1 glutathione peroxidase [Sansalvadorimonas verongulae]